MCESKVQHMTGRKTGLFWFFDFLTNVATGNRKNSEFVQPQLVVRSFAVGFSSISVFFPVQWTGPANTMWKWIIFLDKSKFLLFKFNDCQYAWFKPGQALDPHFIQKTIKHGAGNIMLWGCVMGQGMGRLHQIDGIMCSTDYVEILKKSYVRTLKDYNLKFRARRGPLPAG